MKRRTGTKKLALLSLAAILGLGMAGTAQAQDYHHRDYHRGAPHRDIAYEHHMHDRVWLHSHRHWVFDWRVHRYVFVPYDYVIAAAPAPVIVAQQPVYMAPQPEPVYASPPVYVAPEPTPPIGVNMAFHIR